MDRIRELMASLEARGFDSPYLDRLRKSAERRGGGEGAGLDALKREILGEMAASLGRAEDRVNAALLELELIDREIAELEANAEQDGAARALWIRKLEYFNERRTHAEKRIWELTVQREALGLRGHEALDRFYPLPRSKRLP